MTNATEWHYYSYYVENVNHLRVALDLNFGNATLYLRFGDLPNFLFFDRKSAYPGDSHKWTLTNETLYTGYWYLGNKIKSIYIILFYFILFILNI